MSSKSVLRHRDFRLFLVARFVSISGIALTPSALALSVVDAGAGGQDLAAILAGSTVGMALFILIGGVIADRYDRRRILFFANAAAGVCQIAAGMILVTGNYRTGLLFATELAGGVLAGLIFPAVRGIVRELVTDEELKPANALLSSTLNLAWLIGPTLGATVAFLISGGYALVFDGVTYLVASILLVRIRRLPRQVTLERHHPVAEFREGWTAFVSAPWLWRISLGFMVTNAISAGLWGVLVPLDLAERGAIVGLGVLLSARTAGSLIGSMLAGAWRARRPLGWSVFLMVLGAVPLVLLAFGLPIPVVAPAAVVSGVASGIFTVAWYSTMQFQIGQDQISRVSSFDTLVSLVSVPLGLVIVGQASERVDFRTVFLVGGVVLIIVFVPLGLHRSIRAVAVQDPEPARRPT
jgi:MFS family permease